MAAAETTLPLPQASTVPPQATKKGRAAKGAKKNERAPAVEKDPKELAVQAVIKHIERASDRSHRNTYETFRSFIKISIASLRGVPQDQWEDVCRGSERVLNEFSLALAVLIERALVDYDDILGTVYMRASLGNARSGQYFTPGQISLFMGQMAQMEQIRTPTKNDPFRIADLSCGSGVMLMAAVAAAPKEWREQGLIFAFGVDIDELCASMATLNLILHGIEGQIIRGDGLAIGLNLRMRDKQAAEAPDEKSHEDRVRTRISLSNPEQLDIQSEEGSQETIQAEDIMTPAAVIASLPQMTFDWTAPT